MIQKLINHKKLEGLDLFDPNDPDTRFSFSKKFVLIEIHGQKKDENDFDQYFCFYLRPFKNNQTIITAYVPELDYLNDLRVFNKVEFIKFLSRSKIFTSVYKNTDLSPNKPFIKTIDDFTDEYCSKKVCFHLIIDAQLTPNILNPKKNEYKLLEKGAQDIVDVVSDFIFVLDEHLNDLSIINWAHCINIQRLNYVIKKYEEDNLYDFFINRIDYLQDDIKHFLLENKAIIVADEHYYRIGYLNIYEEDRKGLAHAIIMAEVFHESLKNSGIIFIVPLNPKENLGWYPSIILDPAIKNISRMLNNVHKKEWAKIDKSVFKNMPNVTDFWFYSNPYHSDAMLHLFVNEGDKTNYDLDNEISYKIVEPNLIESTWSHLDFENVWRDYGSFNAVGDIIDKGLMILFEYIRYYPTWQKAHFIKGSLKVLSFALNPLGYPIRSSLKKLFKLD